MNMNSGDDLLKEALRVLKMTKCDAEKNGFKYKDQSVVTKTIKHLEKYFREKEPEPLHTFLMAFANYVKKHKLGVYKCR